MLLTGSVSHTFFHWRNKKRVENYGILSSDFVHRDWILSTCMSECTHNVLCVPDIGAQIPWCISIGQVCLCTYCINIGMGTRLPSVHWGIWGPNQVHTFRCILVWNRGPEFLQCIQLDAGTYLYSFGVSSLTRSLNLTHKLIKVAT